MACTTSSPSRSRRCRRWRADWLLLPHGGSVGRNYGPVIVAPRALAIDDLRGLRVGVPGATTTCARLVALAAPGAVQIEVPSAPLERAFAALADGVVDACALIHEGRLTYAARGLQLVCDLGKFWQTTRNLPLPLGGNVIKRALGDDAIARASTMLRASIAYVARASRRGARRAGRRSRAVARASRRVPAPLRQRGHARLRRRRPPRHRRARRRRRLRALSRD